MVPTPVEQTFTNVACTACGCVCDDLTLQFRDGQLISAAPHCPLAEQWLARWRTGSPPAQHRIGSRQVSYAEAIQAATQVLRQAQAPLIYGLSRSSTPGQRAAIALADRLGGVLDTTASVCHGPSIMAIQEVGESTCSLGEISQRADLVIYWGANPVVSHPRHLERYSAEPVSEWLPQGRRDRRLAVVDVALTETARQSDLFLEVAPGRDFELIWQLRAALRTLSRGGELPPELPPPTRELLLQMTNCRYGAVFFGLGIAQAHLGHAVVAGLLRLVAELNRFNRFVARRLRIPGDVAGADSTLCWQTGYPFAVDFSRGYPRYQPGEFTANSLLERGDVDACVLVGAESLPEFSGLAREQLQQLPTIVLDPPHAPVQLAEAITIHTATYGLEAAGTAYRMDEIPIPLRKLLPTDLPTDEQVLNDIRRGL
jgi:formylmethanofuran dehydrogenase subunit B